MKKSHDVDGDKYLRIKDVVQIIPLGKSTLYDLVERKKIPHYRVRKTILFKLDELQEWMREQAEQV